MTTSFIQRRLKAKITLGVTKFRDGSNVMVLDGFRMSADITKPKGQVDSATITIFGLHPDNMNAILTIGGQIAGMDAGIQRNKIELFVVDIYGNEKCIYSGEIFNALVDYNNAPNVPINIASNSMAVVNDGGSNTPDSKDPSKEKLDGFSLKGSKTVTEIVQEAVNRYNAVHTDEKIVLKSNLPTNIAQTDYSFAGGSLKDVLDSVKKGNNIEWSIDTANHELLLNAPNTPRTDTEVIELSRENGLIGYPVLTQIGCNIKAIYSPYYQVNAEVLVKSMTVRFFGKESKGDGKEELKYTLEQKQFQIEHLVHRVSSMMPSGPWETEFYLTQAFNK